MTGLEFHAGFGLGNSGQSISAMDAHGVALAAIQGLNAKPEATLAAQARELAAERAAREAQAREIAEPRRMFGQLVAGAISGAGEARR